MIDLQNLAYAQKAFTISLASWLLHFFDKRELWPAEVRASLEEAIAQSCEAFRAAHLQQCSNAHTQSVRKDPRSAQIASLPARSGSGPVKVFTDYEVLSKEVQLRSDALQLVSSREEADFVLTTAQVKDFLSLPLHQRVCQFPYESALIRKDLLPLTVRQFCCSPIDGRAPVWWLPCFDLSTEFHLFAEEHARRGAEGRSNRWIIKPAVGTRGFGHRIVEDSGAQGVHFSAILAPPINDEAVTKLAGVDSFAEVERVIGATPMAFDGVDRVAQLLVDQPLLLRDRKFDMRCFVLVKSFEPFEAYFHQLCYARLAYKPYNKEQLHDPLVAITVCCYNEDETVADGQERVIYHEMQRELDAQYGPGFFQWEDMRQRTIAMLGELFRGAGRSIGHWPNSSAYYAVDVIYDLNSSETSEPSTEKLAQPRLVEVNFMGDWHGPQTAVGENQEEYFQWATDVMSVLALPDWEPPADRLVKL